MAKHTQVIKGIKNTRTSPSLSVRGEQEYQFNGFQKNRNCVKKENNPSRFRQIVIDKYKSMGCSYIHNEYNSLKSKLITEQNAGLKPIGGMFHTMESEKLDYIYKFGKRNGCWSASIPTPNSPAIPTGMYKVNSDPNNTIFKTDPRNNFECKRSNASYGVKKVNGVVVGDIKRPLI